MSADKRKKHQRAMTLLAKMLRYSLTVNRSRMLKFHRKSDQPDLHYLLAQGYAIRIREGARSSKSTRIVLNPIQL